MIFILPPLNPQMLGASPIPPNPPPGSFLLERPAPIGCGSLRSSAGFIWSVGDGVLLGTGEVSDDTGGTGEPSSGEREFSASKIKQIHHGA